MSSINNAKLLCERALKYLRIAKEAFNEGLHDVSATNCQISAELLIKSTYLLLGYLFLHRKLLSVLAQLTNNKEIEKLVKEKRKDLNLVKQGRRTIFIS